MSRVRTVVRPGVLLAVGLLTALGLYCVACPTTHAEEPTAVARAQELSRAFRAAAQKVVPTVVMVKTSTKPRVERPGRDPRGRNPFRGTPLEDFFDDGTPFHGRQMPRQQGVGSGVIIDSSGLILTNNHVIDDADEVVVELADGRQFKATDIKTDEQTDLAVLRIKAEEKLPAAKLGDSSKVEIGDWVLAVGNPFELEHTVSAGIISGMKRLLPSGKRADYIQTDAAINPGNSGGPLVNLDGEVIGINTAIASSSGGYQGVGFAIPVNLAKWVTTQLVEKGSVERAYLGVSIVSVTTDVAEKLGVKRNKGVLVTEVFPDTPAAEAGIQEGDVVTHFADQSVNSPHELQERVERAPFGSKQQVRVLRDGKTMTVAVEVKAMPEKFGSTTIRRGPGGTGGSIYSNRELGVELADLTPKAAQQLGFAEQGGVVITAVDPDGLAATAGLREGALVLRVGRTNVKSVAEFVEAMKKESLKDGVMLLVRTNGGNRFVVLRKE